MNDGDPAASCDQRMGHQEDDDQVEHGGQAQGEREALHLADSQHVQDRRRQERHGVGGQDRPLGPLPPAGHRGPEGSTLPDLVLDAFEVDDERVGGDADGDDQTGDAGHVQAVVDPSAEQHQHRVDDAEGQDQRQDGDDAEQPVVDQAVDDHQQQADAAGDQARLAGTPGPSSALTFTDSARSKASGSAPNFSELASAAAVLGERTGDLGVGVVIGPLIRGAEITWPSRVIAVRVPMLAAV